MSLALCRVDDRLVHGQVVIGWGRPLHARFIVLVDDGIRASAWEEDLYRMAMPADVELLFASTAEANVRLESWVQDARRGILLTGDLATMAALYRAHPGLIPRINLGGMHHRHDRVERLRYIYLTSDEQDLLRQLTAEGAQITAQDLPTSVPVGVPVLAP